MLSGPSGESETGDIKAAVKVLRNRYTDDVITRERFMQEARTVAKRRRPPTAAIYEVGNWHGRIFMVMDFIEGMNLREGQNPPGNR